MPIFSILFIGYLVNIFITRQTYKEIFYKLFFLTSFLTVTLFQGYFMQIGSVELSTPRAIVANILWFFAIYIFLSKKIQIPTKPFIAMCIFLIVIVLGMIQELFMPYEGPLLPLDVDQGWDGYIAGLYGKAYIYPPNSFYLTQFKIAVQYVIIILAAKAIFSWQDYVSIGMKLIKWSKIPIYYGFIEFIIKNVFNNTTVTFSFTEFFFGASKESTLIEAIKKGGDLYILQGFTREASHYVIFLFTIAMLILFLNTIKKKRPSLFANAKKTYSNITLISCIILMFLTGGFSAVWLSFVLFLTFILLKYREANINILEVLRKKRISVIISAILLSISLYFIFSSEYFMGRLTDAFFVINMLVSNMSVLTIGNEGIGSTIARFTSIIDNAAVFCDRPLLGLGLGMQWAHDTTIELLVNIGVLGVYTLYRFFISTDRNYCYDKIYILLVLFIGGLPMKIVMPSFAIHILIFLEYTTIYMNDKYDEYKDMQSLDVS